MEQIIDYKQLFEIFKYEENIENILIDIYDKAHPLPKSVEYIYKYYFVDPENKDDIKKMDTLLNQEVYLVESSAFNDPFDDKAFWFDKNQLIEYGKKHGVECRLDDIYISNNFKKIACFTKNGKNSMPMWAHYANNHQGFCVEYDLKDNFQLCASLFPVQYLDQKLDITDILKCRIEMAEKNTNPDLFIEALKWISVFCCAIKHDSWSYEKEYRVILSKRHPDYLPAKPNKIYMGSNCKCEKNLKEVANKLNIDIYKMAVSLDKPEFILDVIQ